MSSGINDLWFIQLFQDGPSGVAGVVALPLVVEAGSQGVGSAAMVTHVLDLL